MMSLWLSCQFQFTLFFYVWISNRAVLKENVIQRKGKRGQRLFSFVRLKFALPNDDDMPSHLCQQLLFLLITLLITFDLIRPIVNVCLR